MLIKIQTITIPCLYVINHIDSVNHAGIYSVINIIMRYISFDSALQFLSLSFSVLFIIIVIDVIKHYLSRKTLLLLIILMPIVNIIRCQYYIID